MNYLYHKLPDKMKGKNLYPLNELKKIHPEIYKEEVKKYKGREFLLKRKIPVLNCLWNDVIHLTPIHPRKLRSAFHKAKVPLRKFKWVKINPYDLEPQNTTIYLFKEPKARKVHNLSDYEKFTPSKLNKYNKIKDKTINYYKGMYHQLNKRPMIFMMTPHILHRGKISIKDKEIIEA